MSGDGFSVRTMTPRDIALAVDWAAAEGWNPGLSDAACFAAADPGGFLVGEYEGRSAATISLVNYGESFAFLGCYIVRPDLRGRGFGLRTWQAAIARAGTRVIGLDGVVAQQDNYRKSGFAFAYNNVRYGGVPLAVQTPAGCVPLSAISFAEIERDDARMFPAARSSFLRAWISAPGHDGRALIRGGRLAAWGVIRLCRRGRKIGPLIAEDRTAAEAVFAALVGEAGGEVFLDVPEPNKEAVALARSHALTPVFETARMYTGPIRPVAVQRIFGVTTFELG